jgi:hypothetical protein
MPVLHKLFLMGDCGKGNARKLRKCVPYHNSAKAILVPPFEMQSPVWPIEEAALRLRLASAARRFDRLFPHPFPILTISSTD